MTVSTHVYTAYLVGSPDVPLKVKGGRIQLDSGRAPHVQADLEIAIPGTVAMGVFDDYFGDTFEDIFSGTMGYGWIPDTATLEALDPRMGARVRIDVSASFPTYTQVRSFNLSLRDRSVRHSSGAMSLSLASDESLLGDYAPLVDDLTPLQHQASLRSVVNYVLNEAVPGTSLAASPSHDAPMTVFSNAENLFPDPRVIDLASYPTANATAAIDTVYPGAQDGVGHQGLYVHTPTGTDSRVSIGGDEGDMRLGMRAGKTYVFSMTGSVRTALSGSMDPNVRRIVAFYRVGTGGYIPVQSPQISDTVNATTRVSVEFTLPEDTTEAFVRAYLGATTGAVTWALPRLTEKGPQGADDITYFWGGKPDTSEYLYEWSGTEDDSTSRRTALIDRAPELLIWKSGRTAMEFLAPIVQYAGLRLVCDETRTWTLRDETYTAPGGLTIRHGVNLIDGTDTVARDSGFWFDAAVTVYTWTDSEGNQRTASDAFALTIPYTRLMTFYRERTPYPGPGFSQYAVQRAQGRGREVSATAVADWTGNAEQPVTIILQDTPTQTGINQSVQFDMDSDEMTVTTRTTETPFGAIDLLTGTIDSLTGTIDGL